MLSRAENDVANYLKLGLSNKDIADKLCICEKTVKFHLTSIYKKFGVSSRSEFIAKENGNHINENEREKIMNYVEKKETQLSQGARQVQVVQRSQEDKITFIDEKFRVGDTINQLHSMMKEVTKDSINPNTVNAACNCVARLNETINTAIQAAKFLNER